MLTTRAANKHFRRTCKKHKAATTCPIICTRALHGQVSLTCAHARQQRIRFNSCTTHNKQILAARIAHRLWLFASSHGLGCCGICPTGNPPGQPTEQCDFATQRRACARGLALGDLVDELGELVPKISTLAALNMHEKIVQARGLGTQTLTAERIGFIPAPSRNAI